MTQLRLGTFVLCFHLIVAPMAKAVDLTNGFARSGDVRGNAGNVFISGDSKGAVLMKVNLWGAVVKSGIHYVPPQTDFVTLLSYAGGPFGNANLEKAYIKRQGKDSQDVININIKDLVSKSSAHNPLIEPNDIIVVPEIEPTVSDNTFKSLSLVSTILSVVLAGFVLENQINN